MLLIKTGRKLTFDWFACSLRGAKSIFLVLLSDHYYYYCYYLMNFGQAFVPNG